MIQHEFLKVTSQLRRAWEEERRVRMTLLKQHARLGIVTGVLMLVGGASAYLEVRIGVWTRPVLGGLALLSGGMLLYGLQRTNGALFEVVGLALIGLWDCVMLGVFIALCTDAAIQGGLELKYPWDLTPFPPQPALYPVGVYLGIAAMIWGTHLPAAWRDHRERRYRKSARPS